MQCLNKYKEMEFVQNAKILTLSMDENWTEFRKNNVMGWILQKENANEIISEATSSQTRQNQKRKNYEEDFEMDKKILNRRLVYEPTVPRKKRKDS